MYSLNASQSSLPVLTAYWLSIRYVFVVSENRSKYRSDRIGLVSKVPVTPHAETIIDSHGDGERASGRPLGSLRRNLFSLEFDVVCKSSTTNPFAPMKAETLDVIRRACNNAANCENRIPQGIHDMDSPMERSVHSTLFLPNSLRIYSPVHSWRHGPSSAEWAIVFLSSSRSCFA